MLLRGYHDRGTSLFEVSGELETPAGDVVHVEVLKPTTASIRLLMDTYHSTK